MLSFSPHFSPVCSSLTSQVHQHLFASGRGSSRLMQLGSTVDGVRQPHPGQVPPLSLLCGLVSLSVLSSLAG